MTHEQFADLVRDMRKAQKQNLYYTSSDKTYPLASKELEKKVDNFIEEERIAALEVEETAKYLMDMYNSSLAENPEKAGEFLFYAAHFPTEEYFKIHTDETPEQWLVLQENLFGRVAIYLQKNGWETQVKPLESRVMIKLRPFNPYSN